MIFPTSCSRQRAVGRDIKRHNANQVPRIFQHCVPAKGKGEAAREVDTEKGERGEENAEAWRNTNRNTDTKTNTKANTKAKTKDLSTSKWLSGGMLSRCLHGTVFNMLCKSHDRKTYPSK